jgi:hypothetical protein
LPSLSFCSDKGDIPFLRNACAYLTNTRRHTAEDS